MRSIPFRGFSVQAQPVGGARLNPQAFFGSLLRLQKEQEKNTPLRGCLKISLCSILDLKTLLFTGILLNSATILKKSSPQTRCFYLSKSFLQKFKRLLKLVW